MTRKIAVLALVCVAALALAQAAPQTTQQVNPNQILPSCAPISWPRSTSRNRATGRSF
jgi:hypothetical protein